MLAFQKKISKKSLKSLAETKMATQGSAGGQQDLKTDITTLTQHILIQQRRHPEASGDLSLLLTSISAACKWISNVVRKAELLKVLGMTGSTNVQNENVQKLDLLSNEIMVNMLKGSGKTALLVSEEDEEAIFVEAKDKGHYCVVFDPLDGSSNIDCGVSIGTIFGIYKIKDTVTPGAKVSLADVLRPGSEMTAAGYCMYGSSTVMVLTLGQEVNGYTLDPNIGEFLLTHPHMRLASKKIYSINEGNAAGFNPAVKAYVDSLKFPTSKDAKPYSARYVGSMVADVHRTLLYGGIFMYPGGKLRMLYECFPMAKLVEAAGGKASNGQSRILDLVPSAIHARSGIFLGTKEEVEKIEALYKEHNIQVK